MITADKRSGFTVKKIYFKEIYIGVARKNIQIFKIYYKKQCKNGKDIKKYSEYFDFCDRIKILNKE